MKNTCKAEIGFTGIIFASDISEYANNLPLFVALFGILCYNVRVMNIYLIKYAKY